MQGNFFVSFHKFDEGDFGLQQSQVLSDAGSGPGTKPSNCIIRDILALLRPSLRPKLSGPSIIFLRVVETYGWITQKNSFLYWNIF
jgi:hypothetical protein